MAARRGGRQPARKGGRGRVWSTLTAGDRPYVLVLIALLVLVAGMALGPLQMFTAATDRVDRLEEQRDQLRDEVDELEDRQRRLDDHDEIERIARSELGLIRPGEIPFIVVPPEGGESQADPPDDEAEDADYEERDVPLYRRLGRWLSERLGADG